HHRVHEHDGRRGSRGDAARDRPGTQARRFLQFSVVHPATGTPVRRWVDDDEGEREALAIGGYFYDGPLTETWIFCGAPEELRSRPRRSTFASARRTLAGWFNAIPEMGNRIGRVVLDHGTWKATRETACADLALGGVTCPPR